MNGTRSTMARFAPLAALVLVPLVLLWPVLAGGRVLYWGTTLLQFIPWHTLAKGMLLRGHVPLWAHELGFGAPLLANLQSAVLYPPNLLYLTLPVDVANGALMFLHLALAGLFMDLFARLHTTRPAALLSALAYGLGGYVVGRSQFITMVAAYAWLPLLFWLADRAVQRPTLWRVVALGLGLALQVLAGHAQTTYYTILAMAAYALWRSGRVPEAQGWGRRLARSAVPVVGAGLLALLVAAAQVLPTADLLLHSQRPTGPEQELALTYSFWPWRLLTLFAPDLFGNPAQGNYWGFANYWEDHAYLGVLPLVLALYAVVRAVVDRVRRGVHPRPVLPFAAGLAGVSLFLALGNHNPAFMFLYRWFPGLALFQGPSRVLVLFSLSASLLAGIGLDMLPASLGLRRRGRLLIAGGISAAFVGALIRAALFGDAATFAPAALTLGVILACIGVWLAAVPVRRRDRLAVAWKWAAPALAAADLVFFALPIIPTARHEAMIAALAAPQSTYERVMTSPTYEYRAKFSGFTQFRDFGDSDTTTLANLGASLLPNLPALHGSGAASNYDPLVDSRYSSFLASLAEMTWPQKAGALAKAGVDVYITDKPEPDAPPVVGQPLDKDGSAVLRYAYTIAAEPPVRLVPNADFVPDGQAALACVRASAEDGDLVCLEGGGSAFPAGNAGSIEEPSVESNFSDNSVDVRVSAPTAAVLFIAQTFDAGWAAHVDGRRAPILRADYLFQAVVVPAGEHRVSLRYEPAGWRIGAGVSAATAALLLAGGVASYVLRRRAAHTNRVING